MPKQSAMTGVEWQDVMSQLRTVDIQEIMARAGEALSKAPGGTVVLGELEVLSNDHRRNFIARAAARYSGGSARSVISGLAKEWVACSFLAARAPGHGHGSALLAGNVAGGIVVFEDLGANLISLVDPLLKGTAQEAERAPTLYANGAGPTARGHRNDCTSTANTWLPCPTDTTASVVSRRTSIRVPPRHTVISREPHGRHAELSVI
jgi:hypothetical protein